MQSPLEIKFHPLDLSEFGKTPGGLSLFRIVWSDSRVSKLSYEGKIYTFGRYEDQPSSAGKWILEKWLPPEKYVGMTQEQYEAFFASQYGAPTEEYPTDGEYELVYVFPDHVDAAKVRQLIEHLEWRLRNVSLEDRKKEVVAEHEQKLEAAREAKLDLFEEISGRDAPKEEVNRVYVN